MFESLLLRYNERRNKDVLTLLILLQSGRYPQNNEFFSYSSKYLTKIYANKLLLRLYPSVCEDEVETEVMKDVGNQSELEKAISTFFTPRSQAKDDNLNRDMKLFEASGEKTNRLCALQKSLLSMQPIVNLLFRLQEFSNQKFATGFHR